MHCSYISALGASDWQQGACLIKKSHEAIWKWVQKYTHSADRFRTDRHAVRVIFVDETLVRIN
jgi:transposase-like protein